MKYTQYTVDAFSDRPMHGNPAAVLVADAFPDDDLMQLIARENNYTLGSGWTTLRAGQRVLRMR